MGKKLYNQEFKTTIVDLLTSGKTAQELSEEYEVSLASIHRWNKQLNTKEYSKTSLNTDENILKIKSLEKELKGIKTERDILKKAVSIFSKSDS